MPKCAKLLSRSQQLNRELCDSRARVLYHFQEQTNKWHKIKWEWGTTGEENRFFISCSPLFSVFVLLSHFISWVKGRIYRHPQDLPCLEVKIREAIQTNKHSNIHDDIDPGTLKSSPETFGVSHYKATLSLYLLIIVHPFLLFSVYWVLTFMDWITWDPLPSGLPWSLTN